MSEYYRVQYLKDYQEPAFKIKKTELTFQLYDNYTLVTANLTIEKVGAQAYLDLVGTSFELVSIEIDGNLLKDTQYKVDTETLRIEQVPDNLLLTIVTKLSPHNNFALSGLYRSEQTYCTQCEAHGFSRITYYLDRPDVLSEFYTRIEGDKKTCPVMLSNGNLIEQGEDGNRHWVLWHDPFLKPCYLFALVAGDLAVVEDRFITQSERSIALRIYVEHGKERQCLHAMTSLKKAMRWDEDAFGREYDLDIFMIVAVSDFNAGAMENKGLNIFNDKYILADPSTATDQDFLNIESVVAHEYFHNWTGNRITCRDWFQLSLKEGLTVYRDQEFSREMNSTIVNRIQDVATLKQFQFKEDAGPNAHSVQPDEYIEVNNFYTPTVYEKGAEVIRMMEVIVGKEGFRNGMDLYFEQYDGQAVTIHEFADSIAAANNKDFTQFKLWYKQAGTPILKVRTEYDSGNALLKIHFAQSIPPTPNQTIKQPMVIPIRYGLLSANSGKSIEAGHLRYDNLYCLTEAEATLEFQGITERPVVSLLRGFSAPVKLEYDSSLEDRFILLQHDIDGVNRYEVAQSIYLHLIEAAFEDDFSWNPVWTEPFESVLKDDSIDHALRAKLFELPSTVLLTQSFRPVNISRIHSAYLKFRKAFVSHLKEAFLKTLEIVEPMDEFDLSFESIARRSLFNQVLHLLASQQEVEIGERVYHALHRADNMTDQLASFRSLVWYFPHFRDEAIKYFYDTWHKDHLVMDKWFSVQAMIPEKESFSIVKLLMEHKAFNFKNPNKLRALVGAFANFNPIGFHLNNPDSYNFIRDVVKKLDPVNPQVAARLAASLENWSAFVSPQREGMLQAIEDILALPKLSKNTHEILSKAKNASKADL